MSITDVSWRKQSESGLGRVVNGDTTDTNYPWMAQTTLLLQRRVENADMTKGPIVPFGMACTGALINYSRYILLRCVFHTHYLHCKS